MKRVIAAMALLLSACQSAPGAIPVVDAAATHPIILGEGFDVVSRELGETRRINVYLPPGYAGSGKAYPVLYLLDGGVEQDFVHIAGLSQHATISGSFREMIVIGIETKDRRRELTAPALSDATLRADYPTHGDAATFRAFVAGEVMPWVEKAYRTSGHDVLIGESLAGLFVAETFLRQPGLFDGYIAIDPSLWWDNNSLPAAAPGLLAAQAGGERTFYLASAKGVPMMRVGHVQLATAIGHANREGLAFVYRQMDDEAHATIYHRAALDALRVLFANPPEATP